MVTFTRRQPAINFKYFDFLNRETLVDVTIIADGHIMQAHKVVLAAASSYFEDIFALIPDKHPAIVLSDVTQSQLTNLMEFIYCGRVELHDAEVARFRKLMQTLKMESKLETSSLPSTATFEDQNEDTELLDEVHVKEEKPDVESVIDLQRERADQNEDNEEEEEEPTEYTSDEASNSDFRLPTTLMTQEFAPPPKVRKMTLPMRPTTLSSYSSSPSSNKPRVKLNNVVRNESAMRFMILNPELCPFCRKVSKSNKHRNEHVKYCMSNPDRIVSRCPHCEKSFCDPYYVRKHMKTIHGDDNGHAVTTRPPSDRSILGAI